MKKVTCFFTITILCLAFCCSVHAQIPSVEAKITINKTNNHSGGELQVVYAAGNKKSGKFIRPLIIAEVYDPADILKGQTAINLAYVCEEYPQLVTNITELLYYDIIYLNYNDGVDDIFRNAQLLEAAIDTVNARKGTNEQNVVLGVSMGGLVARYCLASMEKRGKDHQTRKYISLDVPHKGANVPVGFQAAIRDLRTLNVTVFRQTIDPMQQHLKAQLHF